MLIGLLSKKTGFSRDTIRFYEKKGLIPMGIQDNRDNNYKNYSEETLQRLFLIKKIKAFGFTLNEISTFLDLLDKNIATCDNVGQKFLEKVKLIDAKIKELQEIRELVIDSMSSCLKLEKDTQNCPLISNKI